MKDRAAWSYDQPPIEMPSLEQRQADHQAMLDKLSPQERADYEKSLNDGQKYMHDLWVEDGKKLGTLLAYFILTIWGTVKVFLAGYTLGGFVCIALIIAGFCWLTKKLYGNG